jgi:hypothetical protein
MMRMRGQTWLLFAVAIGAMLTACAGFPSGGQAGTPTTGSGIEGIAEAEPQCPIASPGAVCPPKPVSQTVAVLDANGN